MPPPEESSVIRAFAKVEYIPSVNAITKSKSKNRTTQLGGATIGNNKYQVSDAILFHDEALLEWKDPKTELNALGN